jgi:hypothetical protein
MIWKQHWVLLPARFILGEKNLKLSPLGVVPQRDRRPRTISDYSFFGVNDDTIPLSPSEAMQFGRALQRILRAIARSDPRRGPVYLSKIDIADGFYRIGIRSEDIPKLGVLFPSREGEDQMIGFPLVLPMGWSQSPPIFSAATETVADLANQHLKRRLPKTPHRLDDVSETTPPPEVPAPLENPPVERPCAKSLPEPAPHSPRTGRPAPLKRWDVYVDDFIGMVQGGEAHRRHVKRALLATLDTVFRRLSEGDNGFRQEPASVKKMLKGDATWATRKVILGWLVDTLKMTIEPPPTASSAYSKFLTASLPAKAALPSRSGKPSWVS